MFFKPVELVLAAAPPVVMTLTAALLVVTAPVVTAPTAAAALVKTATAGEITPPPPLEDWPSSAIQAVDKTVEKFPDMREPKTPISVPVHLDARHAIGIGLEAAPPPVTCALAIMALHRVSKAGSANGALELVMQRVRHGGAELMVAMACVMAACPFGLFAAHARTTVVAAPDKTIETDCWSPALHAVIIQTLIGSEGGPVEAGPVVSVVKYPQNVAAVALVATEDALLPPFRQEMTHAGAPCKSAMTPAWA